MHDATIAAWAAIAIASALFRLGYLVALHWGDAE